MKITLLEKTAHAARGIGKRLGAVAAKAMCLGGCVAVALTCSATEWNDGTYTWSYSGFSQATITGVSLTAGGEVEGNLTIPDTVGSSSIPVTIIGDGAFQDCKSITGVTIPNGVTLIGVSAFEGCEAMTSVVIPATATTIGDSAFQGCTSLVSVYLPDGMSAIATSLFRDCSSLEYIEIPDSVIVINGHAFDGCTKLETVHFGSSPSLTLIDEYAFYGCEALYLFSPNHYDFEIPDGVSINAYAFSRCNSLTNIYLPDGIGTIGEGAFAECASLEYARLPCKNAEFVEGLETGGVFAGCPEELKVIFREDVAGVEWSFHLEGGAAVLDNAGESVIPNTTAGDVTIPATLGGCPVTEIGEHAFYYCDSLTSVEIPEGVTSIGDEAFYSCDNLTTVIIPGSVKSIGEGAFQYCDSLTTVEIPEGVTSIGDKAFYYCDNLTTVNIPGSVTSIGDYAFYNCFSLTTVEIPESVTSIGEGAFQYCDGLTTVEIPEGVTSIGDKAFYYCDNLTTVNIPGSVKSIGDEAFSLCPLLTTVNIAEGVESIGEKAFSSCSSLKTVEIPESVKEIGDAAFHGCDSLADADGFVIFRDVLYYYNGAATTVDIPAGVTAISDDAFYYNTSITTVTIPEGVTSIGDYAFYNCSSLTTVTIPEGVTSIGDYAFQDCSSLASVTIPESVTSIGDGAFSGCTGLAKGDFLIVQNILYKYTGSDTSVVIPDGVTKVDEVAFAGNNTMMSVTFPATVTSIGNGAFNDCTALASVTFPDALTSIGNGAFDGCTALASVTFPDALTSIGASAFEGCTALASVKFPESLTSIGDRAFYGCDALESVEIPLSVASIGEYAFAYCDKLEKVAVKSPGTSIGDYAFLLSYALAEITLPAASNKLGKYAFYGATLNTVHVAPGQTDGVRANIAATQDPPFDTSGITFIEDCDPVLAVTFESTFVSIPPETRYVYAGSAVGTLPALTHEGYTLIGWFTEDNAGVQVDETTVIDENVTFYALWLQDGYERWIDTNGIAWIYCIVDGKAEIYNDDEAAIPYSTEGVVTVPGTLGGCPVTRIGDWAFEYCEKITGVVIPESVVSIGENAFECCSALENVEIPATVAEFGDDTFIECTSLVGVALPEGITAIEDGMFEECSSLETLVIPSTVTSIGYCAFHGCISLQIADLPAAVKTIDESAYEGCTSLENVIFRGEVESIGDYAFTGCTSLRYFEFPGSATAIGISAFSDCTSLESVYIEEGVTSIGQLAFKDCTALTDVTFPNTLQEIGYMAFSGCKALGIAQIPDSVTEIWEYAFSGCEAMRYLTLSSGISSLPFSTFENCTSLQYVFVPGNIKEICSSAFAGCTALEEVEFEFGVETIDSEAFNGCTSLGTLTIPKSVTFIGADAFLGTHLATVYVDKGDTARVKTLLEDAGFNTSGLEFVESTYDTWTDGDGVTWSYCIVDGEAWIDNEGEVAISGKTDGEITVPSQIDGFMVTTIGAYAFEDCAALTKVNIPDTVTSFDSTAFLGCDGLADDDGFVIVRNKFCYYAGAADTVVVPDGVEVVGRLSLGKNPALLAVVLPNTVTRISPRAFFGSTSLATISIPSSVANIGRQAFENTALAVVHVEPGATDAVRSMLEDSDLDTTGIEFVEDFTFGCTVTFDAMGGTVSPSSVSVEVGGKVGALPEPERPGYVFIGWFTVDGIEVTADTVIGSSVTFYAQWEKIPLFWHTSRAEALAEARRTGRMVFMICGRDTCANTQATKNYSCEEPAVSAELDRKCVLWYTNCDTQTDENGRYMAGLGSDILLPIVCIIDPDDPEHFIARTTGYLTGAEILEMLQDVREPIKTLCTVTFDPNGGTGGGTVEAVVGEAIGDLPAASRENYIFLGWFTADGVKISSATKVMDDTTFYAHWIAKDDPAAFWYDFIAPEDVTGAYAVPKAVKVYGAVFDGNDVVGIVELKLGKVNIGKRTGKVSGTVIALDGKKYSAKGVPLAGIDGASPQTVTLAVKTLGNMTLTIGGGIFSGTLGDYHVQSMEVGGNWTKAATASLDSFDASVFPGRVFTEFLPLEEPVMASGGKWVFNKAAKIKWAKVKPGVEPFLLDSASGKGLVVDTTKGCTNLSGIKLTYAPKKGTFKGKFRVYELQGSAGAFKLKKYNAKAFGVVVGGFGFGQASSTKPFFAWPLSVR